MMSRILPILFAALTVALIAAGSVHSSSTAPASTPEGAVQSMFANAKAHNWAGAYSYVAGSSNVNPSSFERDLQGRNSSLKTYSQLESIDTRVLHENDQEAMVRAELKYSTAVGAFYDTRDLPVGHHLSRRRRRLGRAERRESARAHPLHEPHRARRRHHHHGRD